MKNVSKILFVLSLLMLAGCAILATPAVFRKRTLEKDFVFGEPEVRTHKQALENLLLSEALDDTEKEESRKKVVEGFCLFRGEGIEVNIEKALGIWTIEAEKGYPPAEYLIARCYQEGHGLSSDDDKAFKYSKLAADKGYPPAQHYIAAYHYSKGIGVEKNLSKAFTYLHSAAETGIREAITGVGIHYNLGLGVKKDVREARRWWRLARAKGCRVAEHNLIATDPCCPCECCLGCTVM